MKAKRLPLSRAGIAHPPVSERKKADSKALTFRPFTGRSKDDEYFVTGEGFRLALVGIVLGTLGALGLTRLLTGLLFGVSATDPLTFVAIALLLAAVALLASYLPAYRAAGTDPLVALRQD